MRDALYVREGDRFIPTERTCSPWGSDRLHGGAVAGLLAWGAENLHPNPEMRVVRITNDLFRPAPRVPVRLEADLLREGRRISVLRVRMVADGQEVAMATVLRARAQPTELPAHAQPPRQTPPGPDGIEVVGFLGSKPQTGPKAPPGMHSAVEVKPVVGMQFKGEGTAWLRITCDVVQGQPNSSVSYMGMMSDYGNGLGQVYLGGQVACINADIDMHLVRYPAADSWICLESRSLMSSQGSGITETRLYDTDGPIGQVTQSLVVRPFSL